MGRGNTRPFWYEYGQSQRRSVVSGKGPYHFSEKLRERERRERVFDIAVNRRNRRHHEVRATPAEHGVFQ